jgi:hypothetical protein
MILASTCNSSGSQIPVIYVSYPNSKLKNDQKPLTTICSVVRFSALGVDFMPKSEILKGWKILGCADAIYKFWLFQVHSRYVVRFIMLLEFNSLHIVLLILFLKNNNKSI